MYQFSDSTYRIFNKIISYSAIPRVPHRGGWVVGRAGGQGVIFFGALAKSLGILAHRLSRWELFSKLIKYSLFCYFETNTLMQNPSRTFHPCLPQVMSDIFCGRGMLKQKVVFFRFWGRACSTQKQMVTSLR